MEHASTNRTRLAIVGTQVLACPGDRDRSINRIYAAIEKLKPDVIISGGAEGIDSLAFHVAVLEGYDEENSSLIIHSPTVQQWQGPGGYRERNEQIVQDCTHLLRIACKQSKTFGSGWTADQAEKLGKAVVRWSPCLSST